MFRITTLTVLLWSLLYTPEMLAVKRYGQRYCNHPDYQCIRVKRNQSWRSLFPEIRERDLVQRLNRMNIRLRPGMKIAVPKDLRGTTVWDIAPMKMEIPSNGRKTIVVNQQALAWGAYTANGKLAWWGPISSGKNYCADVGKSCKTVEGVFEMYHKRGVGCVSTKFPVGKGGARMPYCMFFKGGYAMHGSYDVPGYRASHGCVRLFNKDAQWLHEEFVDMPGRGPMPPTKVIVQPL